MDFYVVEDWDTDEAITVDWDLSDDEEETLVKSFENETLDFTANGGEWIPVDEAYKGLFAKTLLA